MITCFKTIKPIVETNGKIIKTHLYWKASNHKERFLKEDHSNEGCTKQPETNNKMTIINTVVMVWIWNGHQSLIDKYWLVGHTVICEVVEIFKNGT